MRRSADIAAQVAAAADAIREHFGLPHDTPIATVGIVLGSGLGHVGDTLTADGAVGIDYGSIPGFPMSSVAGHSGRLLFANCAGANVLAMQGRVHRYEGYSADEVVFPIRVLAQLGVRTLILTNAAGGVNLSYRVGDLMLIRDHINMMSDTPTPYPAAAPINFKPANVYSTELSNVTREFGKELGLQIHDGVYAGMPGPNYETPAEIHAMRLHGADAVGMSTVLEALAAWSSGLKVVGISCITNAASGIGDTPLDHTEVTEAARTIEAPLSTLILKLLHQFTSTTLCPPN